MEKTIESILNKIQKELKAPKGQVNKFGGYKYRSCEDIVESVKPLLDEAILLLNDELVLIGDRFYIKATASIVFNNKFITVSAFARESLTKKGMDESQITGATSSYARKYALNGLFCIDDTKDADATNKHDKEEVKEEEVIDAGWNENDIKLTCTKCKCELTQAENTYSLGKYGKSLCRKCQSVTLK